MSTDVEATVGAATGREAPATLAGALMSEKLDAVLERLGRLEARLSEGVPTGGDELMAELRRPVELILAGLTDEMVVGLVRKVATLGELLLDPFVLDAIGVLARALKEGQSQYPDVKVPPVGGVFGALRAANDEDTRRVVAFALAVAKSLGKEFR